MAARTWSKLKRGRCGAGAILSGVKTAQISTAIGIETIRIQPIDGMLAPLPSAMRPWVARGSTSSRAMEPNTARPCVQPHSRDRSL